MPFDGSGNFTPDASGYPAVSGTVITAAKRNAIDADFASGLSTCITRNGQSTPSANLPMAGFKFTDVGLATARNQFATLGQIQDGTVLWGGVAGGTANALTLSLAVPLPAYAVGQQFVFKSGATPNSGAATLAIDGLVTPGAIQSGGAALNAGQIEANQWYRVIGSAIGPAVFQISKISLTTLASLGGLSQDADDITTVTPVSDDVLLFGDASDGNLVRKATIAAVLALAPAVVAASETASGIAELATQAETDTGTDDLRIITPLKLKTTPRITLGTEVASTSGTSIDFTGIPAGVRRVTVMFIGVSTSGTSNFLIQLGDSGGIETTGYSSTANDGSSRIASTTGFLVTVDTTAAAARHGVVTLVLEDASDFTWACSGALSSSVPNTSTNSGSKALSAELTQVRVTTAGGADTFDLGTLNISYER